MWAYPSKIPTEISFTSSSILIEALSEEDKRGIPFVELAACNTRPGIKNNIKIRSN